jgi:hypothetical protein
MGLRPARGDENQRRRAHVGARHGVPLQWPARVIFIPLGGPCALGMTFQRRLAHRLFSGGARS